MCSRYTISHKGAFICAVIFKLKSYNLSYLVSISITKAYERLNTINLNHCRAVAKDSNNLTSLHFCNFRRFLFFRGFTRSSLGLLFYNNFFFFNFFFNLVSLFFNYLNGAKAAGLNVGVYFYSAAVNQLEAVQEASLVVQRLRGFSLEMPVYLDIEYSGNYPGGRADTLSMAKRMENIKAFCRTIENAGYSAGIYSSEIFFPDELSLDALSRYDIWMASYTENNALPSQKVPYNIWQLTDRGRLPGISGTCDINVMF